MVDNGNQMTMDDLDQIIAENPPGTIPPVEDTPPAAQQSADGGASSTSSGDTGNSSATATGADGAVTGADGNPQNTSQSTEGNQKRSANDAFAAMRVQNRKMSDALAAVLEQHGLDPNLANDPDALIQQAQNQKLEAEAQRQNVPKELLQRLTQLETRDRENQQKRLADAALAGFQAVKNQYGLDNQGIAEFARQLQEAGTNPFEQEMDLVQHYKLHNLDKIIAAETQKAVEAALKNQKSSAQFSSQPSKTQGKESTGTEQIDTMAKFDRFLLGLQ